MSAFGRLLHAEFTKFRTVRGWLVAVGLGLALMMWLGVGPGMIGGCDRGGAGGCVLPVGPGGEEVSDSFTYVHRALAGDGTITVRVAALTSTIAPAPGVDPEPKVIPWAKAGLIIKDGTKPGSTYAAVLLTGSHGVRMQHDYTYDRAGRPGAGPRWLRLTRAGDTITAAESADGAGWTTVGAARLPGLPATAQAGLFVTSPQWAEQAGPAGAMSNPSRSTGVFDHLTLTGAAADWTTTTLGAGERPGEAEHQGDTFTLSGSGDIAPAVAGAAGIGVGVTQTLVGTFVALLFIVVISAMFVAGEYRRGLIRTTLAATPGRGRVLAAKAVVIGAVSFVTGLVAAAFVVTLGPKVLRANGVYVHPVSAGAELRIVFGTAALLAGAAVFALAVGVLLRRGTVAVTTAIVLVVLPYLLAMTVLPTGPAQWLLRVTPAAAFAVQQSTKEYAMVENLYNPPNGYFPLPPWAGFAVLAAWVVVALAGAGFLIRRRDA